MTYARSEARCAVHGSLELSTLHVLAPVKAFSASNLPQSVLSGDGWALRGECPRRVRCGSPLKDVLGDRDVLIRLSYHLSAPTNVRIERMNAIRQTSNDCPYRSPSKLCIWHSTWGTV